MKEIYLVVSRDLSSSMDSKDNFSNGSGISMVSEVIKSLSILHILWVNKHKISTKKEEARPPYTGSILFHFLSYFPITKQSKKILKIIKKFFFSKTILSPFLSFIPENQTDCVNKAQTLSNKWPILKHVLNNYKQK